MHRQLCTPYAGGTRTRDAGRWSGRRPLREQTRLSRKIPARRGVCTGVASALTSEEAKLADEEAKKDRRHEQVEIWQAASTVG